jgi:hypothetical protein
MLRIVQCVGEAGAPVTEIARNDEECVCAHEVRRENASECFLFLLVDGSNQDWDDRYFFPNGRDLGCFRNFMRAPRGRTEFTYPSNILRT